MVDKKCCRVCKKEKEKAMFSKNKKSKDGYDYICKECASAYQKEYRQKNRKKLLSYGEKYRCENREKLRESYKKHYYQNREKRLEDHKKYYLKNREAIQLQHRQYFEEHEEHLVECRKKWYLENKEKVGAYKRNWNRGKMANDPVYKFKRQMRTLLYEVFHDKVKESKYAEGILGTSIDGFKEYLKKSWEQYYGYKYNDEACDIDHIVPLCRANTIEEVIKLCHYTNLQLLTPEDNDAKGAKDNVTQNNTNVKGGGK